MFDGRDAARDQPAPQKPRRLPIYLLIDCSGGMVHHLPAVRRAANAALAVLRADPRGPRTAWVSLMVFNDNPTRTPLTPLDDVQLPELTALGKTQLGRALRALNEALDSDLAAPAPLIGGEYDAGFYRPIIFLISDGAPSPLNPAKPDQVDWKPQADMLRARGERGPLHTIALAIVNPSTNRAVLGEIADQIIGVTMNTRELADAIRTYIDWKVGPA